MIRIRAPLSALVFVCLGLTAAAQDRDRSKIDDTYKWNLADLYPSDDAWRAAKEKLVPQLASVAAFKGTLGTSAARLSDALDTTNRVAKELQKILTRKPGL